MKCLQVQNLTVLIPISDPRVQGKLPGPNQTFLCINSAASEPKLKITKLLKEAIVREDLSLPSVKKLAMSQILKNVPVN